MCRGRGGRLLAVNARIYGGDVPPLPSSEVANLKPGEPHYGVKRPWAYLFDDPNGRGYLRAVDPLTGQSKWAVPFKSPNFSGTLVTAGGLAFTGCLTGQFMAVDSGNSHIFLAFQTSAAIVRQPGTWC